MASLLWRRCTSVQIVPHDNQRPQTGDAEQRQRPQRLPGRGLRVRPAEGNQLCLTRGKDDDRLRLPRLAHPSHDRQTVTREWVMRGHDTHAFALSVSHPRILLIRVR